MSAYVDGLLIDWGTELFNQRKVASVPSKKGLSGLPLPSHNNKNNSGSVSQVSAKAIRNKLGAISKRTPEVLVKITGTAKSGMKAGIAKSGRKQVMAQLKYISRDGKLEVEDQEGKIISGRDELSDLHNEWVYGGFQIAEESYKREAFSVILSMPNGTNPLSVKRAARDFAAREFSNHQYAMVLHTFDTDPDPKPSLNPHVHLVIKAKSLDGTRLNPRKADLQHWREGFAEALREHGVEAAATSRLQRLKRERGEKQSVREMKKRGKSLDKVGRAKTDPARVVSAQQTETEVLRNYHELSKALAMSKDVEDKKLVVGIVNYLDNQLHDKRRSVWLEQDKFKDLGR